jgi:repressor LexA
MITVRLKEARKKKGLTQEELIMPGDLALVRETPEVEYGELAVVIVNGEEGTLKRIYKKESSNVLQSSNPSYPPRIFAGDELKEIRIVGRVESTIRKY